MAFLGFFPAGIASLLSPDTIAYRSCQFFLRRLKLHMNIKRKIFIPMIALARGQPLRLPVN